MTGPDDLARAVEALLFASEMPLATDDIARRLGISDDPLFPERRRGASSSEVENDTLADESLDFARQRPSSALGEGQNAVENALVVIAARHAGHGIELVERGGRWHFQTPADLAHLLREARESTRRLSRAGVETLAIIAYHEPVSRGEIEAIRGVQISKGTLDVLIEAGWIAPAGRRQVPGRPLTYATTPDFLTHFGLSDRRDLPGIDDLRAAGLLDPMSDDWDLEETDAELESADESG